MTEDEFFIAIFEATMTMLLAQLVCPEEYSCHGEKRAKSNQSLCVYSTTVAISQNNKNCTNDYDMLRYTAVTTCRGLRRTALKTIRGNITIVGARRVFRAAQMGLMLKLCLAFISK